MDFDLTSKRVVKNLLRAKAIRPSKRMGQHFLVRRTVLRKIIEGSELKTEDIVLEIGAGMGTLTEELAQRVKKVIAVEKDSRMVEILKETLKDFNNLEIILGDILNPETISYIRKKFVFRSKYKVVANLPYNIATEVIRKFIESTNPPKLMVLMVQKEVGKRICSKPPKMERLAVLVGALAKVKILDTIKKNSFWPQPKVDSVILRITPLIRAFKKLTNTDKSLFSKIVKAGFSHPRKQLAKNLFEGLNLSREKVGDWLSQNNIQPTQRAQTLSLNDWLNLTKSWNMEHET